MHIYNKIFLKLALSAAFHKVVQSNFGMILAINSELKSISDTLISFACKIIENAL